MYKSLLASILMLIAPTLGVCNATELSKELKADNVVKTANIYNEKVNCKGKTLSTIKFSDGTTFTQQNEGLTTFSRYMTVSADGKIFKSSGFGEVSWISTAPNEAPLKRAYTYVNERQFEKIEIEKGTFKEVGQYKTIRTGKDGYQFRNKDGSPSPTQTLEATYESVYKIEGNKVTAISDKLDGQELPIYDYEITLEVNGNVETETSVLKTPIKIKDNDVEYTTLQDEQVCTTETIK